MSDKNKTIHALLHEVQTKLKAPKNQYNSFGKYKYRSCEDILEGVKAVLPDGCYVTISDDIKLIGTRFYVQAVATFSFNGESIQSTAFAREEDAKKGMDSAQLTGATSSYARKYALNGLFCIDDTKDADSQDNSQKTQQAKPQAKPQAKQENPDAQQTKKQVADIIKSLNEEPSYEFLEQALSEYAENEFLIIKEKSENAYNYLMAEIEKIKAKFKG